MGKRWIVLVNKTPRGPLSATDVAALISQNLVRRNDLAYLVPEDPSAGTAEWKFLWQFPEFDRRKDEILPQDPAALSEAQRNRRQTPSEIQIKEEVKAALPSEFANIQPEDLVLSKGSFAKKDLSDVSEELPENLPELSVNTGSSAKGWLLGGAAMIAVTGILFVLTRTHPKGEGREALENLQPQIRGLAEVPPPPPPPPPPSAGMNPGSGVTSILTRELPKPKEGGEIPLDEYRKQREERLEKERLEEEEKLKAEQRAQEEDAEEAEGGSKKKVKKKRKVSAADEEDIVETDSESAKADKAEAEESD